MSKIVGIFTEGGTGIGLGHLSRCYAVSCALRDRGCKPVFLISSKGDVSAMVRPFMAHQTDWKPRIGDLIRDNGVSFAIIDSYLAGRGVYDECCRVLKGRMLSIDDYKRLKYPGAFLVNPSVGGAKIGYPRVKGQYLLLGKDYIILRPEFWEAGPKKIADRVKNIFITFGGDPDLKVLNRVASFVKKHTKADICVLDSRGKIHSAAQMRRMMRSADLCISGGGQTVYELARMGVPTISMTLADNQVYNVRALQSAGISCPAGRIDDDRFLKKLLGAVRYMEDPAVRKKCSIAGQMLVDGKGARRLAGLIAGRL